MPDTIQIRDGSVLELDAKKWCISQNTVVRIISEDQEKYEVENENGIQASIRKEDLARNELMVSDDSIDLGTELYHKHIVHPAQWNIHHRAHTLYENNQATIFKNPRIVLSKAEYYLIKPKWEYSTCLYRPNVHPTLGQTMECLIHNELTHLSNGTYRFKHLVTVDGSELQGAVYATYWTGSGFTGIRRESAHEELDPYPKTYDRLAKLYANPPALNIDFHDLAILDLLNEIKTSSRRSKKHRKKGK
jgi:hypothetical protein